jgi:ribosomal protein S12 methylthiotransferase
MVGQTLDVLVEGPSDEGDWVMVGRHRGQAPEIDGSVFLSGGEVRPGEIRRAHIVQAADYDLVGEVDEAEPLVAAAAQSAELSAVAHVAHRSSDGRRVVLKTVS